MDCVKMEPLLPNKRLIKSMVWQNFSLLFDGINSETFLGYAIYPAGKICETCCL